MASSPSRVPATGAYFGPLGRRGPWFAAIWLFFLVPALSDGWSHRGQLSGLVGIGCTVLFGGLYLVLWLRTRSQRQRLMLRPALPEAALLFIPLVALGAGMAVTLGPSGAACVVYLAVSSLVLFRFQVAAVLTVAMAVLVVLLGEAVPSWGSQWGLGFSTVAAFLAMFGITSMLRHNVELIKAHDENARLAVENERNRMARDLHDILGHSLTVITVKAELAQRLFDLDSDRARVELADLERLSRDALTDVRRAVDGYRELTLPGELARARVALRAAEIDAELPNSTEEVPTDLRELFAWTVREGVTNVIRHSRARRCSIAFNGTAIEVRDDGVGPDGHGLGSGLMGLSERAGQVGASVVTESLRPGYSLRVLAP